MVAERPVVLCNKNYEWYIDIYFHHSLFINSEFSKQVTAIAWIKYNMLDLLLV
jgi:hypothetical protein